MRRARTGERSEARRIGILGEAPPSAVTRRDSPGRRTGYPGETVTLAGASVCDLKPATRGVCNALSVGQ